MMTARGIVFRLIRKASIALAAGCSLCAVALAGNNVPPPAFPFPAVPMLPTMPQAELPPNTMLPAGVPGDEAHVGATIHDVQPCQRA